MTVSIASTKRDGRLCTITCTLSSSSNATTSFDVVGNIVQAAVNRTKGSGNFTLTLEDTSTGMEIFTKASLNTADINPSQLNSGSGAFCRGPLKITGTSVGSDNWTVVIYYIKM